MVGSEKYRKVNGFPVIPDAGYNYRDVEKMGVHYFDAQYSIYIECYE